MVIVHVQIWLPLVPEGVQRWEGLPRPSFSSDSGGGVVLWPLLFTVEPTMLSRPAELLSRPALLRSPPAIWLPVPT
ncbi:hypothetical protein [Streptomyces solincola]|uniref:hypothetical protein n=1 Tax=Streptomyces solincola TaxID=2100817 RepID=UPI0011B21138|nr:hypothetical protein [Streptomyces solincola]